MSPADALFLNATVTTPNGVFGKVRKYDYRKPGFVLSSGTLRGMRAQAKNIFGAIRLRWAF